MTAVAYEVRVTLPPDLEAAFAAYMTGKHIPEILATGCFRAAAFERLGPGLCRTRYEAASQGDLDRYLEAHAPHFRADFLEHFPPDPRVEVSREVWTESWRGVG